MDMTLELRRTCGKVAGVRGLVFGVFVLVVSVRGRVVGVLFIEEIFKL